MQTLILHGVFDLVTPYYASQILINQMALDTRIQNNIELKLYHGGHMPYLQQDALNVMFEDIGQFYEMAP
jgi:carboxypeptidase C (cathepsin A)